MLKKKFVIVDSGQILNSISSLIASENTSRYHLSIFSEVDQIYKIAYEAKQIGYDPKKEVEIYIAQDVATRTEGLVGPKGIATRLKTLEETLPKNKIVLQIAREIAQGKFVRGSPEILAEQALRTALSYQTEGITAAPIEGIGKVKIKSNPDKTQYLAIYYSGPIRSAGGTAQGISVIIANIISKELGLAPYKATDNEIERMLEEVRLYDQIMHLQLPTSDDEIRYAWKNLPIMITGNPTESEEVAGYRNIESMDSNRVRGGACLVLNDGLVGRAKKIIKRIKELEIEGWDWLGEIADGKYTDKRATDPANGEKPTIVLPDYSYISDALMGRPIFAGPTMVGGFRLRYGHARNTGIAGIGIHPGVMGIVNDYLATGTHLRTERPGKGSIVAPVDTIAPPIVILNDGEMKRIESYEEGVKIYKKIKNIVSLGDMLVGFGEFIQNNYRLCPAGFNEEWWLLELEKSGWTGRKENETDLEFISRFYYQYPSVTEVIELSKKWNVPLHPRYTPSWKFITVSEVNELHNQLWSKDAENLDIKIKPILEKLLIPHFVEIDRLNIGEFAISLKTQLPEDMEINLDEKSSLTYVQKNSDVQIRDTVGTTIGARMGRPEKAKGRLMKPQLHGLFPIGSDKKINRNLSKAVDIPQIRIRLGNRYCSSCNINQYHIFCKECNKMTFLQGICSNPQCRSKMDEAPCDVCGANVYYTKSFNLSTNELLDESYNRLGSIGSMNVKLMEQLKNPTGTPELLDKAILRARYKLNVFRDGTVRYDATDAPLTHFFPREIGTSIKKLRELGYTQDVYGNNLDKLDQLVELKVQDIIPHKSAFSHFKSVSKFIDDELSLIYELPKFYKIRSMEDLIGHLVIGLAPHTSAGVIGRIIGLTESSVCWAHPFWHAAKRRNCDGDEDGLILLLDGFLNFSKEYLPTTRGSKMDTPLVLVLTLNPKEVDDEAFNLDCVTNYPLELYEAANNFEMPNIIKKIIHRAEDRLGKVDQFEGFVFSHPTTNISSGPAITRYKNPDLSIRDKLYEQLDLAKIIKAVDVNKTALLILERHVLPDLIGNLRAFASQKVRCITCNSKYRRVPLSGKCINAECDRSNLVLTVPPKGVSKYFDICKDLVTKYDLGKYHENRIEKIKIALDSHFPDKGPRQLDLSEWL